MMDQAESLRVLVKEQEDEKSYVKKYENATVIAITSGKGGVGKTSITVNIASLLVKQGKKVLIIDADLGLSNVEIMLGVTPSKTLRDLMKNSRKIEDIIIKGPYDIDFISGGNGFMELTELTEIEREEILIKFQDLDTMYDIILIDTGAGISKNVTDFLLVADFVIAVATSEPTALTDAYSVIKVIKEQKEDIKINLIINRVKDMKEYRQASDVLIATVKKFLGIDIIDIGFVFEDGAVKKTIFKKMPFVLSYPDSKASVCIKHILSKMSFEVVEDKGKIVDRFKKWLKKSGGDKND